MNLDLSSIAESQTGDVSIVHPVTKVPLGITIAVAGPEHPKRKAMKFSQQRKLRARIQKAGKLTFDDPENEAEEQTDYLVGCTLGWNEIVVDGKALAYSAENARTLYTDSRFAWLREQVQAALDEREVFIKASAQG